MKEPVWVDRKALLILHLECLAEHGGLAGIRDEDLFHSALAKPQNAYVHGEAISIFRLAAAYGFGLARNHPFLDGNKRIALIASGLLLALNGYRLSAPQLQAIQIILDLASGTVSETIFAAWMEKHSVRLMHGKRK